MKYRQWVVDVIPGRRPHAERPNFAKLENQTLVLFRDRALQIDGGQQNENICLQQRYTDVQSQENYGDADGYERKENQGDHVTGEHVSE